MITYVNKELFISNELWTWKLCLESRITSISQRDCGKTHLYEIIKDSKSDDVIIATEEDIRCGFEKVVKNKLIVIDNCDTISSQIGETVFDSFINNMLFEGNSFLLLNWDGVGIYITESRIITLSEDTENMMTTGGV